MRRGIAHGFIVAVAVLVCTLAAPQVVLAGRPHILLRTPQSWQVVQRGANDRADIVVSGRCFGVRGIVRVAWGDCRAAARCGGGGRFDAVISGAPTGQSSLRVWSARRPDVRCVRVNVGVGDIYVIAGQSNASGRSPYCFGYSSATLRAAMFGNDYRWQELRDPVDSPAGQVDSVSRDGIAGGSVWPDVATVLLTEEGAPVAFVPCARASTPIARWDPALQARRAAGTLYSSMTRRVEAVGGRVRAVLWWQGERDARFLTPSDVYVESLRRLASACWRDFRAPLVAAQVGDYDYRYTAAGIDALRQAQERAWGKPHIVQGPVLYDIDLEGEVHFREPDDVAAVAHRWAAAILGSVLGRDAGRTPRLLFAVRQGDEVVLTANSDLADGADLGGFVVRSAGREVPIAAVRAAGDTVHIVLTGSAEGALYVSLGAGRSGAGAVVPTDASAWRLPMLPFVEHHVVEAAPRPEVRGGG